MKNQDLHGEYRLVPIHDKEEEMEGSIDLGSLFLFIRQRFRILYIALIVGVVTGVFHSLTLSKEYDSSALLIPESGARSSGGANNLLKQYGGLLGIGGVSQTSESPIPPQLFPEIVNSVPFQIRLLTSEVRFSSLDKELSSLTYFNEYYKPSLLSTLQEYTLGLPRKIVAAFQKEEEVEGDFIESSSKESPLTFSSNQLNVINNMQGRIGVLISQETGIIEVKVTMPDPKASADLAKISIDLITEYVIDYKVGKAEDNLIFISEKLEEAKKNFEKVQRNYARFSDSNINISSSQLRMQESFLRTEYDLAFEIYKTMLSEFEQAKIKVQEQTPVVTLLDPVVVPVEDNQSGFVIVLRVAFVFLFISFISIIVLFLRDNIENSNVA